MTQKTEAEFIMHYICTQKNKFFVRLAKYNDLFTVTKHSLECNKYSFALNEHLFLYNNHRIIIPNNYLQ